MYVPRVHTRHTKQWTKVNVFIFTCTSWCNHAHCVNDSCYWGQKKSASSGTSGKRKKQRQFSPNTMLACSQPRICSRSSPLVWLISQDIMHDGCSFGQPERRFRFLDNGMRAEVDCRHIQQTGIITIPVYQLSVLGIQLIALR